MIPIIRIKNLTGLDLVLNHLSYGCSSDISDFALTTSLNIAKESKPKRG